MQFFNGSVKGTPHPKYWLVAPRNYGFPVDLPFQLGLDLLTPPAERPLAEVISYSSSLSSATPWRLALDLLPPLRRAAVRGDGAWQNQGMVAVGESGAWRSAVQLWEARA